MGCVGLIRIIYRISRTLFPPNHITKTDRKCQQNRIPPSLSSAHIFTSIMMIIPLPRNFSPSLPAPYFVPAGPTPPPRDGPAFVSPLIWFSRSPGWGFSPAPQGESRCGPPGAHHPIQGAWRGDPPPKPRTHPAGEDCPAAAWARKQFRKHSFWLNFPSALRDT